MPKTYTHRDAAEQLVRHLRRKNADAAYFSGPGLCALDLKHLNEHGHGGLAYILETVCHEWLHSQHPRWDHRKLESCWKREVIPHLALRQFARGVKTSDSQFGKGGDC